jgi:mRNA-degrading endonuclease RelE of RelBE toxin-antitoxin system
MYGIDVSRDAKRDLGFLPAHMRARMLDAIERGLRHEPLRASRNRKPLSGALAPRWELRVGEHRVFYRVAGATVQVLRIMRKGRKSTGDLT